MLMASPRALKPLVAAAALSVASSATAVAIPDRIEGAFFGALVADALSLGAHYEYDSKVIKQAYGGTISKYMAPGEKMGGTTHGVGWGRQNYHPGQKAGDQTDYGEYNLVTLEYLAQRQSGDTSRMSLDGLLLHWKSRISSPSWGAWRCTQSKQTLQQLANGVPHNQLGGMSNAMAIRNVAAFAVFENEEDIVHSSKTAMFTHQNGEALGGGEFFSRVVFRIIHKGLKPIQAIEEVAAESPQWFKEKAAQGVKKFMEATNPSSPLSKEEFVDDLAITSMARLWEVGKSEPIKVGKASPTEGTLPSSIYMILKYQDDPMAAFKENAMVGGDSASRAIAIGMVLGAYHGKAAIPKEFQEGLHAWNPAEKMLQHLPLLAKRSKLESEL